MAMAKAAFTLFCFVDTIGIGTMAPTVFGHAEYRVGAEKSRLLSFGEAQEGPSPQ